MIDPSHPIPSWPQAKSSGYAAKRYLSSSMKRQGRSGNNGCQRRTIWERKLMDEFSLKFPFTTKGPCVPSPKLCGEQRTARLLFHLRLIHHAGQGSRITFAPTGLHQTIPPFNENSWCTRVAKILHPDSQSPSGDRKIPWRWIN